MSRYGGRACELRVGVHTTHGVGHTVGSRACRHVIRVERSACTAARCNGEVAFAHLDTFFFVRACNRVLEARRVGGVACDGYVYAFHVHDSNAFTNVVCAEAANFCTRTARVRYFANDSDFARSVVELCLYVGEAVDTADDLSGVFAETVEDYAKRSFARFVRVFRDTDSTFCRGERFVACEEREAFRFVAKEHTCEVTVTKTYFAVVGNGAGDTERLKADTDSFSRFGCRFDTFFDSDRRAYRVSPACIFKCDRLYFFDDLLSVYAFIQANLFCFI